MAPDLDWAARRAALADNRRTGRADWFTRWALVEARR